MLSSMRRSPLRIIRNAPSNAQSPFRRPDLITVFEPWPSDVPPTWREAYLAAYAILDNDAAHAAMLLQKLMAERPADLAVRRLAEQLPAMRKSDRSPT